MLRSVCLLVCQSIDNSLLFWGVQASLPLSKYLIGLANAPVPQHGTRVKLGCLYPCFLKCNVNASDVKCERKFTYNDFLIHTHVFLFTEIQKSHIYQCIDVGSHYKKIDQNGYFLSGSLFFHRAL